MYFFNLNEPKKQDRILTLWFIIMIPCCPVVNSEASEKYAASIFGLLQGTTIISFYTFYITFLFHFTFLEFAVLVLFVYVA
jgi:hypothetical protein